MNKKKKLIIVLLLLALIFAVILAIKSCRPKTVEQSKTTETAKNDNTTKEDKSDKKEEVKADDKKAETKEEPTPTPTETTTPVAPENDVPTNTQTDTYSQPTPTPCVPTYTTVTHPEVGHYEQREVVPEHIRGIYEDKIVGNQTGRIYNNQAECENQGEGCSVKKVEVGAEYVPAQFDNVWVVDQQAWTETVASGC